MSKENGRSMVEMLGVLAIIGVLSAGALAGYSRAMQKYKMNKTIDEFTHILFNFSEIYEKGGIEELYGAECMLKNKLISSCQQGSDTYGNENGACKLPIGSISCDLANSDFSDHLPNGNVFGKINVFLTNSNDCIAFLSTHWENIVPVTWFLPGGGITVDENPNYLYAPAENDSYQTLYGTSTTKKITMTIEEITNTCKASEKPVVNFIIGHDL